MYNLPFFTYELASESVAISNSPFLDGSVSKRSRQVCGGSVPEASQINFTGPGLEIEGIELIVQNKAEWRKPGHRPIREVDESTGCE